MATVFITDTAEIRELHMMLDLQDYAFDILDADYVDVDFDSEYPVSDFVMSEVEYRMWRQRFRREERILEAYDELTAYDDLEPEWSDLIDEHGHDWERLQDEEERLLGLTPWYDSTNAHTD